MCQCAVKGAGQGSKQLQASVSVSANASTLRVLLQLNRLKGEEEVTFGNSRADALKARRQCQCLFR
jgi:hypothetical protein